jgi:hypothetical protein
MRLRESESTKAQCLQSWGERSVGSEGEILSPLSRLTLGSSRVGMQ